MQPHSLDIRATGPGAGAIGDEWEVCACVCVGAHAHSHKKGRTSKESEDRDSRLEEKKEGKT